MDELKKLRAAFEAAEPPLPPPDTEPEGQDQADSTHAHQIAISTPSSESVSVGITLKKETEEQPQKKPEEAMLVCAGGDGAAGSSGNSSSAEIVSGSGAPMLQQGQDKSDIDLINRFACLQDIAEDVDDELSIKERFMATGLVVPAIALKKMRMALDKAEASQNYLAVLSSGPIKRYSTTKPMLQCMVLGDTTATDFWKHVADHFKGRQVAAAMMAEGSSWTMELEPLIVLG